MERFDLIIAGAGPTGAALACALTPWFKRIALVDANPPRYRNDDGDDPRTLALASTSARILAGIGVWRKIAPLATPIRDVRICASGDQGDTHLGGSDAPLGALGFTVTARELTQALHRHLEDSAVAWFAPNRISSVTIEEKTACVSLEEGDAIHGRLLIAADGTRSIVRDALGIQSRDTDYHQRAILVELASAPPAEQTAFEVLTPGGPLALLPNHGRWSAVWVQDDVEAKKLLALDDSRFARRIEEQLSGRLAITELLSERSHYPLHQVQAWTLIGERTALLGNAAHTVHPVGAQGLNLGFRDVATLAELLAQAVRAGIDPGSPDLLEYYARQRMPDHRRVLEFTDTLANLLGDHNHPLQPWLQTGLSLLGAISPLQSALVKLGTGGFDKPTRLGRGLPL